MKYKIVQLKLSKKIKNILKFGDLMNLAKNNLKKNAHLLNLLLYIDIMNIIASN
jgi:hypothetical protein